MWLPTDKSSIRKPGQSWMLQALVSSFYLRHTLSQVVELIGSSPTCTRTRFWTPEPLNVLLHGSQIIKRVQLCTFPHGRNHQKLQRTHKECKLFTFRNIWRRKATIFRFPDYSVICIKSVAPHVTQHRVTQRVTRSWINMYVSRINLSSFSRRKFG